MPLSTLAVSKRMIDAGFTQRQAEAQAEIWAEIVESDLATKRDLKDVEVGLKRDIKELETSLRRDIKELEVGLKHDIKELEVGLKHDIKELEVGLKHDIKALELKMDTWRESMTRQMWQMSMGTAVAVTTLVGFMIRFMGR